MIWVMLMHGTELEGKQTSVTAVAICRASQGPGRWVQPAGCVPTGKYISFRKCLYGALGPVPGTRAWQVARLTFLPQAVYSLMQ